MTSIITGDIIQSKRVKPDVWLNILKMELDSIGANPITWEIFRGDSFQVEVENPADVLEKAIKIKAAIKTIKGIDVRMAIGIGAKSHHAERITEANGTAFVHSGQLFEMLIKDKQSLAIASSSKKFDTEINLYLRLALIAMDNWLVNSAEMVKIALANPKVSQKDWGEKLGIKQNAVSSRLKRAYYAEITELINMYKTKFEELNDYLNKTSAGSFDR